MLVISETSETKVDLGSGSTTFMKRWSREFHSFLVSLRSKPLRDQMKTKNFYAVILFLLVAVTTIWLVVDPSPNFHTIVSETHKQISNIKNIPVNIRHSHTERLEVDPKYLDMLGFENILVISEQNKSKGAKKIDPIIVSPVVSGALNIAKSFLLSVNKLMPGRLVLFYDLGLNGKENMLLKRTCNSTKLKCTVRSFPFNKFPSHVKSMELRSFVPLCIQESLNEYQAIIWADPVEHFLTSDMAALISKASDIGILGWPIQDTTSSITYPKMFSYFDVKPETYYFHRAVKTTHLIVYNTELVKSKIMLPWVKCALVEECISPTGSQNTGYCYQRKPRYLYSGCHFYDQSALNLILGKVFSFSEPYLCDNDKVFGKEELNKTATSAAVDFHDIQHT